MANNEYATFYLKDLTQIIEHVALDLMSDPIMAGKKADGTLMNMAEVANQNSLIAMNNAGIAEMARQLIVTLAKEADPDG
jgi:hypothetical protein